MKTCGSVRKPAVVVGFVPLFVFALCPSLSVEEGCDCVHAWLQPTPLPLKFSVKFYSLAVPKEKPINRGATTSLHV